MVLNQVGSMDDERITDTTSARAKAHWRHVTDTVRTKLLAAAQRSRPA